jgi:hypothetical protein
MKLPEMPYTVLLLNNNLMEGNIKPNKYESTGRMGNESVMFKDKKKHKT